MTTGTKLKNPADVNAIVVGTKRNYFLSNAMVFHSLLIAIHVMIIHSVLIPIHVIVIHTLLAASSLNRGSFLIDRDLQHDLHHDPILIDRDLPYCIFRDLHHDPVLIDRDLHYDLHQDPILI